MNHASDLRDGVVQHESDAGSESIGDKHGVSISAHSSIAHSDDEFFHLSAPRLR